MGMAFNEAVDCSVSLRGFRHRADKNPDGWGLAYFDSNYACAEVFKEPLHGGESCLSEFLRDYPEIKSEIFVAHVRRASIGDVSLANTHPFLREFKGRHVVFAHNGRLENFGDMSGMERKSKRFRPIGSTDSEKAMCLLLNFLFERRGDFLEFGAIHSFLGKLNRCGTMNLLFSEGLHLFAYRDRGGFKSLSIAERKTPFGTIQLEDEDFKLELGAEGESKQKGFIVASLPLTKNEVWHPVSPGELLVFRDGGLCYGTLV